MDEDQINAVFENLSDEDKKKAIFLSRMVGEYSKTINQNGLDSINCWLYEQTPLFVHKFRTIVEDCHLSGYEYFDNFKIFFEAQLRSASINPCIIRSKEEEKTIVDLNEKFNKAKSLNGSKKLFNSAIKKGIPIKEEYKYALFLSIFLDEMNTIAKTHKKIDKEDEHQSCMDVALKIMCALFNFDRFQLSKINQIDRAHQFINAALTRREKRIERFEDFYDYLVKVENIWHPEGKRGKDGLRKSASQVYNECVVEQEFRELFMKHFDVDTRRNKELAINKFAGVVKSFTLECFKQDGHTFNGFCRKPRGAMTQKTRKNISNGRKKNNLNMDDQKDK